MSHCLQFVKIVIVFIRHYGKIVNLPYLQCLRKVNVIFHHYHQIKEITAGKNLEV